MVRYDVDDSDNGEEDSRWRKLRDKVAETVKDMGFKEGSLGKESEREEKKEEMEE